MPNSALRWHISHRIILWLPGQVLHWFPVRQQWRTPGIKMKREEEGHPHFLSLFFFSSLCILLYFLVLAVPFISLSRWIFPFTTVWHKFSLLASKVETKLTVQNSKDYLGVPGTVENILFQNSAFSETLSPLPGIANAFKSECGVHCQR